ncbi:MAG: hybrid sensor histidine kinase/response regulator [Cyanobacteria bacterium]|nr:hybrid sensor histidine kinase/response regulator [Cyanobacteriota bacterium]
MDRLSEGARARGDRPRSNPEIEDEGPIAEATILAIDDNPTNLKVVFEFLRDRGFKVLIASSGESGIERAQKARPDLILLDVMMPGIDGFTTCARLKADPLTQDIPIIFMTALADVDSRVRGLTVGGVDYITKPVERDDALARINIHLQLRQEMKARMAAQAALTELAAGLEEQVQERTRALSESLAQLQQAQVQLIHAEKMSSLGQLVAGVAHEINNPVNFIHGNLTIAQEYVEGLMELVDLAMGGAIATDIEKVATELDFEFVREDLAKILRSMETGTQRIRDIVLSLRNFSRLDESHLKAVDLHEGLDSTLTILNARLKGRGNRLAIEVVRRYGELPPVECYAGPLNQVFMNLLANAIDALDEGPPPSWTGPELDWQPRIEVRTEALAGDRVRVSVTDNGAGIAPEQQSKIFEAFFTTKEIGKGTGLGLSISWDIVVHRHGGQMHCRSELGQGTTFMIDLPVRQGTAS